jgi:hypothetical protein
MSLAAARDVAAAAARVALSGTLLIIGILAAGSTAAIAGAAATGSLPCIRTLRALDAAGRPVFQSVAVALPEANLAALPLHPLERGGARWERLEIAGSDSTPTAVTRVLAVDAAANLAVVEAPGLAACDAGSEAPAPAAGSAIRVARDRLGYRPAMIGGHVERLIALPGGRTVALARLLDDGGADPGLVFDAQGRFLGGTLPPPPSGQPSLVAFSPWGGSAGEGLSPGTAPTAGDSPAGLTAPAGGQRDMRPALPARDTPSAAVTDPGLVAQALLAAGPDAAERGLALLEEVVGHDGENAPLLVERGVLQFNAGRLASAIADFDRAVALDPASHIARFNLGIALGTSGRYADAAEALRGARDLNPTHARTRYQLALALKAARMADEARRECDSLEALDSTLGGDLRAILGL